MNHYPYNIALAWNQLIKREGAIALHYPGADTSFVTLDEWSGQLASLLFSKGCRRGDVIAIGHEKHPLSYALMLAALRLGLPYVVIDVESPLERNLRILRRAAPKLLFYDDSANAGYIMALATEADCDAVYLDKNDLSPICEIESERQEREMREIDGSTIAYIMFTSGSTGEPKGVAVTHQNVLHFIEWGRERFSISSSDVFANLSPMYFDNSVFDFYISLFSGAALAPVPRRLLAAPYELVDYVESMGCTLWFSVPSLLIYLTAMKAMTQLKLPSLRTISFGGEGYPKSELKKLYDSFKGRAKLVNVYGPTECTCICSAHDISDADFADADGLPSLGRLNQNFDYLIYDKDGKEGTKGELCLIGPNVAAGYFNDSERTADSFITITTSARFMKRMYRTGDLVEERDDKLYFVGRKDNQIKHMGYRIELEEIEHALTGLPQVTQAAVLYRKKNESYGKLLAFVSCVEASMSSEEDLLASLAEVLPRYMIPSEIYVLQELPKNANGKVDRRFLAEHHEASRSL